MSLQHEEFKPIVPIHQVDCPNNQNMLIYAEKDARFMKSEREETQEDASLHSVGMKAIC